MSVVRTQPIVFLAIIGLILFWVVQDPVGAAAMIRVVFEWITSFLMLLAERVVQFLGALV